MTFEQAAIICLLVVMFGFYAVDRFRVEVVALCGLSAAFLLGLVPVQSVFAGFSSPAVITVVEVLLIVTVLTRTRAVERFAQKLVRKANSERVVLAVVCGTGAFVSVFMNNIGALALMFPVALSVCARLEIPPARMLMALSFATLLGGMCSLTGTPANLVVNEWVTRETGGSFAYFELGKVGAPVAIAGLIWLVVAAPRLFRDIQGPPAIPADMGPAEFLCEARVTRGGSFAGRPLTEVEDKDLVKIHNVVRNGQFVFARRTDIVLEAGDVLLLETGTDRLEELNSDGTLLTNASAGPGLERLDVVVMPESIILGSRVGSLESLALRGVTAAALASRRRRIEGRFEDLQLGLGDVLMLIGERATLREVAADTGVLPLSLRAGSRVHPAALRSLMFFALGVAATAFGIAPPQIAFGAVVIVMAVTGSLKLRSAFQDLNWPIILLLACMIPIGAAVEHTGTAHMIANSIVSQLPPREPLLVVAVMLLLAVAITPFIDNVSTAAVLSPIAAGVATRAGVPIEPLLMAVAIGASLDFLTPFGHHNNAVVMGAAGHRFTDFPRLGAPLLAICAVTAILFLWLVWF